MRVTYTLLALAALSACRLATAENPPNADPKSAGPHVVIIEGVNKDPEEIRSKDKNVMRLAQCFRDLAHVSASDLFVLTQVDSFVRDRTGTSDAATIRKVLANLAGQHFVGTTVVYYTGQANLVGNQLRLNIPGPDITHEGFSALIKAFGDRPVCVVLDCPGAGLAVKSLAGPNRIVVCAARSDQPTSTRFSDYFIPALTDTSGDINQDGRVSLLEAFQQTAQQIDASFRENSLMKSETALLDDNGDGVPSQHPWAPGEESKDGGKAMFLFTDTWEMPRSEASGAEHASQGLAKEEPHAHEK